MPWCYDGHMRAFALIALTGCRAVLGIEDGDPFPVPPPGDSRDVDVPTEAAPQGCRADYAELPNAGPRMHRYLLVNIIQAWTKQRDACAANAGYLAFPDGATVANAQMELEAIVTLGGNNVWLGLDDVAVEGQYRTSLNMPASQATLALVTANGGGDCLNGTTTAINDENCGNGHKALCECVP